MRDHKNEIYPYRYIFNSKGTILLWKSMPDNHAIFLLDQNGRLISGKTKEEIMEKLCNKASCIVWDELSVMDFDKFWGVIRNLRRDKASSISTCKILLEGWNFIEDFGKTMRYEKELRRLESPMLNKCYDKILYGNNLPIFTPDNKHYNPVWTNKEIGIMRKEREHSQFLEKDNGSGRGRTGAKGVRKIFFRTSASGASGNRRRETWRFFVILRLLPLASACNMAKNNFRTPKGEKHFSRSTDPAWFLNRISGNHECSRKELKFIWNLFIENKVIEGY